MTMTVIDYIPVNLQEVPLYKETAENLQWILDNINIITVRDKYKSWYDTCEAVLKDFSPSDVDIVNEQITITEHGQSTGDEIQFDSTIELPYPLVENTKYYVRVISLDIVKLFDTEIHARGTTDNGVINLTTQGQGEHVALIGSNQSVVELIHEAGYDYISEVLYLNDDELKIFYEYLTLIHLLKGHKEGLELILTLLKIQYVLTEWWEPAVGSGFIGTYTVDGSGVVTSTTIVDGGIGYNDFGNMVINGTGGSNLKALYFATAGVINSIVIMSGGSGYDLTGTLTPMGGSGVPYTFDANLLLSPSYMKPDSVIRLKEFVRRYVYPIMNFNVVVPFTIVDGEVTTGGFADGTAYGDLGADNFSLLALTFAFVDHTVPGTFTATA